jgi:hypothetical protein
MDTRKDEPDGSIMERLDEYLQGALNIHERHPYRTRIIYWMEIFEKMLPEGPQQFFFSKDPTRMDLFLFSRKHILIVADFLREHEVEEDHITIYPLTQIVGGIEMDLKGYSLHRLRDSRYDDASRVTLRLRINKKDEPIEITGTNYDCLQVVEVARHLLANIEEQSE